MTLPEGKAGQALALTIGALLLLMVYASAVQPLIESYTGLETELAIASAQRDRMTALEAALPALRQQAAELRGRQSSQDARVLLPGTSDSVAAAALQAQVQALGKSRGAEVSSVESLAPKVQDGYRRVAVRVVITCTLQGLTGMLGSLASAQPALYVENLDIRSMGDTAGRSADAATLLTVAMDVYGYRADAGAEGGRG